MGDAQAQNGGGHPRDDQAAARLVPLVYDELRSLARRYMQRERSGHTLQPTALVHEACLRLMRIDWIRWQGRAHFLAVASTEMRRVLIEYARMIHAEKRGHDRTRVEWRDSLSPAVELSIDLIALEDALSLLARHSPRQSRVAELKLFAGASVAEMAEVTNVSERTVKADWSVARAYIARAMQPPPNGSR